MKQYTGNNRVSYKIKEYNLKCGRNITYQSNLELDFIEECEKYDIEIWNGDIIEYYHNNKKHHYHVDFKIKINNKFQLVELKEKNTFYTDSVNSGTFQAKCDAAEKYSDQNNYLPYIVIFDDRKYNIKELNEWEVLTPNGWSDFKGIKQVHSYFMIKLIFNDNSILECTPFHKLEINKDEFKEAAQVFVGNLLFEKMIISKEIILESNKVYDLLEVEKNNKYYTNNVISHNCGEGNFFHKKWVEAEEGENDFNPIKLHWTVHPERDQSWRDAQTRQLGVKLAAQECLSGNTMITVKDISTGEIKQINLETLYTETYE